MTSLTPSRDNALRALAQLEEVLAANQAAGTPKAQNDLTRALMSATLLGLASHVDNGVDAEDSFEYFRIAFANVIASLIESFSRSSNVEVGELVEELLEGIWAGVEDAMEGDPEIVVRGTKNNVGHA